MKLFLLQLQLCLQFLFFFLPLWHWMLFTVKKKHAVQKYWFCFFHIILNCLKLNIAELHSICFTFTAPSCSSDKLTYECKLVYWKYFRLWRMYTVWVVIEYHWKSLFCIIIISYDVFCPIFVYKYNSIITIHQSFNGIYSKYNTSLLLCVLYFQNPKSNSGEYLNNNKCKLSICWCPTLSFFPQTHFISLVQNVP